MICAGIEEAGRAQRGNKQSGGLFVRSREIPLVLGHSRYGCGTEPSYDLLKSKSISVRVTKKADTSLRYLLFVFFEIYASYVPLRNSLGPNQCCFWIILGSDDSELCGSENPATLCARKGILSKL